MLSFIPKSSVLEAPERALVSIKDSCLQRKPSLQAAGDAGGHRCPFRKHRQAPAEADALLWTEQEFFISQKPSLYSLDSSLLEDKSLPPILSLQGFSLLCNLFVVCVCLVEGKSLTNSFIWMQMANIKCYHLPIWWSICREGRASIRPATARPNSLLYSTSKAMARTFLPE